VYWKMWVLGIGLPLDCGKHDLRGKSKHYKNHLSAVPWTRGSARKSLEPTGGTDLHGVPFGNLRAGFSFAQNDRFQGLFRISPERIQKKSAC
jgi:hypothetical protein